MLGNGGFELPYEIGIPGWMHAHHPPGAVEIDMLVRSEGQQSIRLGGKTDAGASTWLISREVARPTAGRIGVSMSLRGEPPRLHKDQEEAAKHRQANPPIEIRVAIEGERDGQAIRRSETVQVPRDGKWNTGRLVLEWLDVDPVEIATCMSRLIISRPRTLWIDDHRCYRLFR